MWMMSTENCQKKADLIMERSMADLCCSENDGIIPCASAILKLTIDGYDQRKALHKLLVDATSLQKSIRRSFILTRIVRNSMVQVRMLLLHDPNSSLITSKEQCVLKVFNPSSLRLVGEYSTTSDRLKVPMHSPPYLYRGLMDTWVQFCAEASHKGWRLIWVLCHFFQLHLEFAALF